MLVQALGSGSQNGHQGPCRQSKSAGSYPPYSAQYTAASVSMQELRREAVRSGGLYSSG